jgi:hypothetical protein
MSAPPEIYTRLRDIVSTTFPVEFEGDGLLMKEVTAWMNSLPEVSYFSLDARTYFKQGMNIASNLFGRPSNDYMDRLNYRLNMTLRFSRKETAAMAKLKWG